MSSIPQGWVIKESTKRPGVKYYFNTETGESSWDHPPLPTKEAEVRVLHILKKHRHSRRPSSWRIESITQTKEEAIEQISNIINQLSQVEDPKEKAEMFKIIASTESDCSSASSGGDLGFFGRGKMQKQFETASFALSVGGISGIVDSDSGIHVIFRVA